MDGTLFQLRTDGKFGGEEVKWIKESIITFYNNYIF
jgi:hypothetical protein